MLRILVAGNKSFTDDVANSYENNDVVAMLTSDGELSITYHTFDSLPNDWMDHDAFIMSPEDAKTTFGQNLLNDRTPESPTMGQMIIPIFIAGQMNVSSYVNVEAFDDHYDILRHILEDML